MSPDQYEDLCRKVREKKERLRKQAEAGDWELRREPRKTLTLPNLPEPKQGLTVPKLSHEEREIHRLHDTFSLPNHIFKHLMADDHDGN
jgi:hypothetical protein